MNTTTSDREQVHQRKKNEEGGCHSNHLYAQRLNNVAASYIESGQHDKAVAVLVKALCLSPNNKTYSAVTDDEKFTTRSECPSCCSLDECIAYSEERSAILKETKNDRCYSRMTKRRRIDTKSEDSLPLVTQQPTISQDDSDSSAGYTHERPILITPAIINNRQVMGATLSLIITFNLALANHLKLLQTIAANDDTTSKSIATRERLGKVLRLYELAYQWEGQSYQRQYEIADSITEVGKPESQDIENNSNDITARDSNCVSLRFDMIVCNNLSQIHRMAQNYSKQKRCLQHLLSVIMFVIDWQRESVWNDEEDTVDERQQQEEEANLSEGTDASKTLAQNEHQPSQGITVQRKRSYMDLDGFWRNISPFLLKDDCAKAA